MHFVYVMSQDDKDKMTQMGFKLLRADECHNIWVFENPDTMTFDAEDKIAAADISFILSDMLTF